jgi:hypothetical protein
VAASGTPVRHTGRVTLPDDLLGDAPLEAGVAALAERNHHHLEQMSSAEREEALAHWRELAIAVLTAAGTAVGTEPGAGDEARGRAMIVLEDVGEGEGEIAVHASFFPELQDLGGGEVVVTPAQAAALELLDGLSDQPE